MEQLGRGERDANDHAGQQIGDAAGGEIGDQPPGEFDPGVAQVNLVSQHRHPDRLAGMLDQRVDPSLLGGLTVKVGSRMIDTSIRTKLNSLKHAMKEVG